MKHIKQYLKEKENLDMPDHFTGDWLVEHDLPMIIHCTCCKTTMVIASAYVDDDGYLYCRECARED